MFAPPKKKTGTQLPKRRKDTNRKRDVTALVKDLSDSYRQLDDYVTKEKADKKNWNQFSVDNITRKKSEFSVGNNGTGPGKDVSSSSRLMTETLNSTSKTNPRKSDNIYEDEPKGGKTDQPQVYGDDMHVLLDAYPKKFHELRQIMEEMKERHAKSINRMRQKFRKDALKREDDLREAAKRDAEAEAEKLRNLLRQQRAKSQRVVESMKLEKQKLSNSQAKSNKALRQTENQLADVQKGLFALKKQLARSQREKALSEQGRIEQRSKAVQEKKRADELHRDIKSLETGIETVRLLNRHNENITQHDYDVLNWKFRSVVKLIRDVESISTPPDLGKIPSLQTVMEARNRGRGQKNRLPAIDYPRRVLEQLTFYGRGRRQVVHPQRKVVHEIPRRITQNQIKEKSSKDAPLALPMLEKKPVEDYDHWSSASSKDPALADKRTSQRSEQNNDKPVSADYASDFDSENSSEAFQEKRGSSKESRALALPMPVSTPDVNRENSSTRVSSRDSARDNRSLSTTSQCSDKDARSRSQSSASRETDKDRDVESNGASDSVKEEHKSRAAAKEKDGSVFLT